MRIKAIACEVFYRELCLAAAQAEPIVDISFLAFGLHNTPEKLRAGIQEAIDNTDPAVYDFVVLAYGLCSRGTAEIQTRDLPLVIPRAHDCITLFLGSRAEYDREFSQHPGTYYYSAGWIERKEGEVDQTGISDVQANDTQARYLEYVEKYGEDNAKFLIEQESEWQAKYTRAALIDTGVGPLESLRKFTSDLAADRGWEYSEIAGDPRLIHELVSGKWNADDFLMVQPRERVMESFDAGIVKSCEVCCR